MRYVVSLVAAVFLLALVHVPQADARGQSSRVERTERALIRAINHQRRAAGLRRVHMSRRLSRAADRHSREMLAGNYFAHSSADGGSFEGRVRRYARRGAVGETLAMLTACNRGMPAAVIAMWLGSPAHRAIMLSPAFRRVGIGRRSGTLGGGAACLVTADFAA